MSEKTEQVYSDKNATISRLKQQINNLNLEIQVKKGNKIRDTAVAVTLFISYNTTSSWK